MIGWYRLCYAERHRVLDTLMSHDFDWRHTVYKTCLVISTAYIKGHVPPRFHFLSTVLPEGKTSLILPVGKADGTGEAVLLVQSYLTSGKTDS